MKVKITLDGVDNNTFSISLSFIYLSIYLSTFENLYRIKTSVLGYKIKNLYNRSVISVCPVKDKRHKPPNIQQ